jgi:hypothetical protein
VLQVFGTRYQTPAVPSLKASDMPVLLWASYEFALEHSKSLRLNMLASKKILGHCLDWKDDEVSDGSACFILLHLVYDYALY